MCRTIHIAKKCMINRILLAGSLGARKQNLRLRLHQTLSKLPLSVQEASKAGDRPVLADLTPQKPRKPRAANATGHQQNLSVMLMGCLCCHLTRAKG